MPLPLPNQPVELAMAGAALELSHVCPKKLRQIFPRSDVMVTVLLSPPVIVMPLPLSTTPYPALEVILRFLNPLISIFPLLSVNTLSSLVVILMSPNVLIFVEYSLITPLSVQRFPIKSEFIVIFFADTSASLIGEPSPRELSVHVMTRFLSGCWYVVRSPLLKFARVRLISLFVSESVSSSA